MPTSNELLTRAASFAPASFDPEARTVRAIWSTGAAVQRNDFEGPYDEVLSMDPNDVDLSELNGGPILNSHDRFDVNSILGVVEDPTITPDGRGVATLRFSDRPSIAGIIGDVRSGVISRISIGYGVSKWDTSRAADGKRTKTARRWQPREISLVGVPADPGARTRSESEVISMEQTLETQIRSSGTLLGVDTAFIDGLIARDVIDLATARSELLGHLQQSTPRIDARTSVTITRDADDDLFNRCLNAVAHRIMPQIELRSDAQPFAHLRLADVARQILRAAGSNTLGSDDQIFQRWGALHSSSDFAGFLAELFNKMLLPRFLLAPSGLKLVTRRGTPAADFRMRHIYRNSPVGQLMPLNQHGEFQRTSKADVKGEQYQVQSFAAVFGITRVAMTNDDLGAFSDVSAQLAQQAAEFENQQLAALLVSNPVMSDGFPLFSTQHKNIAATAAAIDEPGLTAGRLAMRLQTNQNNQPLNVRPQVLLTSAANESAGQQALSQLYPPQVQYVNPFSGDALQLVIDPRLDLMGQSKSWYLFGDIATAPVLEDSYLQGYEGPRVFTRVGFLGGSDLDGTEILCQLDYGTGCIGWQGAFYNAGV